MAEPNKRPSRARERGATLFVVVLAITLLTGVGLYTVHSATLSERAAGNTRQALQARGVAEMYATAALTKFRHEVETDVRESDPNAPGTHYPCESNAGLTGVPCRSIPMGNLVASTGEPLIAPDSFGPLGTLSGVARVDLTDVYTERAPIAGTSAGSNTANPLNYYRATVTVAGALTPSATGSVACVEDMMQVTGQHIIRSHMLFGPM